MDVSEVAPFTNVECPNCGEHSRVKVNFGPYTLTRRYAAGGMSMVFAAHDSTLDREVAVKILSEEYSQDETRIRAFEEEARITASFSHPNVVRVLRTGRAFGRFYIAMELVPGGHFEHHIRERKRIPEEEMLPLAIEVAQGLKAANAAGLIHRDVKPGNILLNNKGHAKLVDFGLSLVTQGGKATATELWATPFYVPPETVQGMEEDFRSDIYALGCTLYHALAGTPPCNEESMATNLLLKAKQEIVPLHNIAPDISATTCSIITRAMAYHPGDRFSSYDEFIHALRESLKQLRKMGPGTLKTSKSRNTLWLTVGLACAGLAALLLTWPDGNATQDSGNGRPKDKRDGPLGPDTRIIRNPPAASAEEIARDFARARNALKSAEFTEAATLFAQLHDNPKVQEPTRSWSGIESTLCHYLEGDGKAARDQARKTLEHLTAESASASHVGTDIPNLLRQIESYPPARCHAHSAPASQAVIASMLAGLKNWHQGMLDPAAECFKKAAATKLGANDQWVTIYQKQASAYLSDHHILTGPLFNDLPGTPEDCRKAIAALNEAVQNLKTKGRARYNLRSWQLDLARQAKSLRR